MTMPPAPTGPTPPDTSAAAGQGLVSAASGGPSTDFAGALQTVMDTVDSGISGISAGDPDVMFVQAVLTLYQGISDTIKAFFPITTDQGARTWAQTLEMQIGQAANDAKQQLAKEQSDGDGGGTGGTSPMQQPPGMPMQPPAGM